MSSASPTPPGSAATDGAADGSTQLPTPTLNDFKAIQSDDSVKTDLELTCLACGEHVCDIEPDDILAILVSVAEDHIKESHSGT